MQAAVVFDKDFASQFALAELDEIWLIDSPKNRAFASTMLDPAAVRSVFFEVDDDPPNNTSVIEIYQSLSKLHPDWTEIHIIGIFPNRLIIANIVAPRGSPSGTFVTELAARVFGAVSPVGFTLTRVPAKPRADVFEIWRKNLPPKGLLAVTDRALQRIVDLRDDLQRRKPGHDWTPSLDWGSGAMKGPQDVDWRERGTRFAVGFSPRSSFPAEAIELRNDVEIVFRLGADYGSFRGKAVDLIEAEGGFVLVDAFPE